MNVTRKNFVDWVQGVKVLQFCLHLQHIHSLNNRAIQFEKKQQITGEQIQVCKVIIF